MCVFVSGSSWACFHVCLIVSSCHWEFVSVLASGNLSVYLQVCVCPCVCQNVFVHVSASVFFHVSAGLCLSMCLPVCVCPRVCQYLDKYKVRDGSCVSASAGDAGCVCVCWFCHNTIHSAIFQQLARSASCMTTRRWPSCWTGRRSARKSERLP